MTWTTTPTAACAGCAERHVLCLDGDEYPALGEVLIYTCPKTHKLMRYTVGDAWEEVRECPTASTKVSRVKPGR